MSAHNVFVLDKEGNPLTPTKPAKAKKLMKAGVAKPVWNKFGQFGIQMLVDTRKETPWNHYRVGKSLSRIGWLSNRFFGKLIVYEKK
jgi:hypothetical protein